MVATRGEPRPCAATALAGTIVLALVALLVAACAGGGGPPADAPTRRAGAFDLQAHRGGADLTSENTLEAFSRALDIGVTTLELDAQVTRDGAVVVAHDNRVNPDTCRDTSPASPSDDLFPYSGKPFRLLTLAQVSTLDCGFQPTPDHPDQRAVSGARVPELREVVDLLRERGADDVGLNVEIKVQADDLGLTVPRDEYAAKVWAVLDEGGVADRATVQSFDWASLTAVHRIAPRARLVALVSPERLERGEEGASPWLGGIDIDAVDGDVVRAASGIAGVVALSPRQDLPVDATLVRTAHAAGLVVVPWTVDDEDDMARLVDLGVDGLITNRPDLLRAVLTRRGLATPPSHPAAG
ncbi:glycerophosphodiester phosphodiesterase family protein [Terracoccus sp. 273MFTsu3.1]|uniref:glycerophosphodiester phosphodiesterase family protein n=1 Tax=Terracoccus sp. 273MFTsu3.1 TaxID=1172188 RepID=UPI0003A50F29|nr:glycerophosphodiester phosphodiesterase family protein [Terracoccus sp. 273MFTsu3.1]